MPSSEGDDRRALEKSLELESRVREELPNAVYGMAFCDPEAGRPNVRCSVAIGDDAAGADPALAEDGAMFVPRRCLRFMTAIPYSEAESHDLALDPALGRACEAARQAGLIQGGERPRADGAVGLVVFYRKEGDGIVSDVEVWAPLEA